MSPLHDAKVVMDEFCQGSLAVGGAGGIADNLEGVVILPQGSRPSQTWGHQRKAQRG